MRPVGSALGTRAPFDTQELPNSPRRLLLLRAFGGKWKRHPGGKRMMKARVLGADLSIIRGVAGALRRTGLPYFKTAPVPDLRRAPFDKIRQQCGPATLPPQSGRNPRFPNTALGL